MKPEDIEIFKALRYDNEKGYYYYIVSTKVRRLGFVKVSVKKYDKLKQQYEKHLKNSDNPTS